MVEMVFDRESSVWYKVRVESPSPLIFLTCLRYIYLSFTDKDMSMVLSSKILFLFKNGGDDFFFSNIVNLVVWVSNNLSPPLGFVLNLF